MLIQPAILLPINGSRRKIFLPLLVTALSAFDMHFLRWGGLWKSPGILLQC